ncbi:hypothetical protein A2U01_0016839 [Trifolium medium]|uniref:Transmembrane protein n=1 Tax=Trifolium medium TaxID=97028 RepID=A0A392N7T2_9FABA|nr:hypothetical protein [Trifolium medium]
MQCRGKKESTEREKSTERCGRIQRWKRRRNLPSSLTFCSCLPRSVLFASSRVVWIRVVMIFEYGSGCVVLMNLVALWLLLIVIEIGGFVVVSFCSDFGFL